MKNQVGEKNILSYCFGNIENHETNDVKKMLVAVVNENNKEYFVEFVIEYNECINPLVSFERWSLKENKIIHRENGPAIIFQNGEKRWFINGLLHRDDGPACESKSDKSWYKNGKLHRESGPAQTSIWYDEYNKPKSIHELWYKHGHFIRSTNKKIEECKLCKGSCWVWKRELPYNENEYDDGSIDPIKYDCPRCENGYNYVDD